MMEFIDVHSHFKSIGNEIGKLLSSVRIRVVCVATDKESSLDIVQNGLPYAFVGVHPSCAGLDEDISWLKEIAEMACGIGEIGLDPKYGSLKQQEKIFMKQLDIAEKLQKPVQVHSRNAAKKCLEILGSYKLTRVLMHWFDEEELTREVNSMGYFASFGPALLYSKKLERIVEKIDTSLILTESDYPVQYTPIHGMSGPVLVPSVVFKVSQILGSKFDDMAELIANNAGRFLGKFNFPNGPAPQ